MTRGIRISSPTNRFHHPLHMLELHRLSARKKHAKGLSSNRRVKFGIQGHIITSRSVTVSGRALGGYG